MRVDDTRVGRIGPASKGIKIPLRSETRNVVHNLARNFVKLVPLRCSASLHTICDYICCEILQLQHKNMDDLLKKVHVSG